ncbi:MAG: fumarylacetoacetate hydrolase family protein [Alphaproteobacteria bacterium]
MKIGRFGAANGDVSTGVLVDRDDGVHVLDLTRAAEAFGDPAAGLILCLIAGGNDLLERTYALIERARRDGEDTWYHAPDSGRWALPCTPHTVLCAGRNFGRHDAESAKSWAARGDDATGQREIPSGFTKIRASLVGDNAEVKRPDGLDTLDYEVEIAVVLGARAHNISEADALDTVFGYTMFNDLSARAWQFQEMKNRMMMIGKNFPGAGPLGPWIVTADEIPDPQTLDLSLTVNGEPRQSSTCEDMIFSFAEMISFWSMLELEPGDVIASGTPEGVAHAHKPDPQEWFLKPGDEVVASCSRIGDLTTHIV